MQNLFIGIDPGVNTGLAIWNKKDKNFSLITTTSILEAIFYVKKLHEQDSNIIVVIEDARLRKWIPYANNEKGERGRAQGAGSIKRDCTIWEDFLKHYKIEHRFIAPKNNKTKMNAEAFSKYTKYSGKTSSHSRDAAMLVFGN